MLSLLWTYMTLHKQKHHIMTDHVRKNFILLFWINKQWYLTAFGMFVQSLTLDAIMKRVVSALSWARVLAMCVPSMLETNHTLGPPLEYGFRASVTMRGPWYKHPSTYNRSLVHDHQLNRNMIVKAVNNKWRNLFTRSDPPMPIFTTSVMDLPLNPFHSPLRTFWTQTHTHHHFTAYVCKYQLYLTLISLKSSKVEGSTSVNVKVMLKFPSHGKTASSAPELCSHRASHLFRPP